MSLVTLERRIKSLEERLNPDFRTYGLTVKMWGLNNGEDALYWLMADDGSPRGRFIRELTRDEVEQLE